MKLKVITETGSFYHIDTLKRVWTKNNDYVTQSLVQLSAGDYDDRETGALTSTGTWKDVKIPVVGKAMLVRASLRDYWITTEVVEVIKNPEDWDEVMNRV